MTIQPASAVAPVASNKRRRLDPKVLSDGQLAFEEFLDANFFGQPQAREMLLAAYANYLNPLRDKNKPIAFLVFAGESRTGKTEAARMIPAFVHNNRFALLKINCSEYMDKHSLWNLKGSPRGHISNQVSTDEKYAAVPKDQKHGYAELMNHNLEWSKQGSEAPLSVVLLDEWDKGCFDLNLLLLQAMDDGQITLGSGEIVDFRNTIFIAACNSGMQEVESEESGGIGFNRHERKLSHGEVKTVVERVIKNQTPPEFRNRLKELGGIAVFQSLTSDMMRLVVKRDFKALQELITASGYFFTLSVTEAAIDEILRRALANKGNLSNVKSLITSEIQIPLGIEATKRTIKQGDAVTIDVEGPDGASTSTDAAQSMDKKFILEAADPLGLLIGGACLQEPAKVDGAAGKTEVDGAAGKAKVDGSAGKTKVDGSAGKTQVEGAGTGEAAVDTNVGQKAAGTQEQVGSKDQLQEQSVIVQDFLVVLRAVDSNHTSFKEAMFAAFGSSPMITVLEDRTQYGDTATISGVAVNINSTAVKVLAPIELMFALKRSMPFLDITTIATPLEL